MKWVLLVFLGLSIAGCEEKFHQGDYVKHKLDGRVGLVTENRTAHVVVVRFVNSSMTTNTKLLSHDDPVSFAPYADVFCYEMELDHAERPVLARTAN